MVRWLAIVVAVLIVAVVWKFRHGGATNEIEYRGETIRLTKSYSDYDDYKNDSNSIDTAETARVQRLLTSAPIAAEFKSRLAIAKAVGEISFPGYGTGAGMEQVQPDGSALAIFSVEIPRAGKDRYFAFRGRNGAYRLIDDFVAPDQPLIMRVTEEHSTLVYSTMTGQKVLSRPITRQ